MTPRSAVIVWFRQDLRLADNPALLEAVASQAPIIPVYLWFPPEAGEWSPGGAAKVWLNGSLKALQDDLQSRGSNLVIRQGPTAGSLIQLAQETGAQTVHCNARYEPWARTQQEQVRTALAQHGITLQCHTGGTLIWEPEAVTTQQGKPYQVFTPFFNRCISQLPNTTPLPAPVKIQAPNHWPDSLPVESLRLLPTTGWDEEIHATWQPGETAAQQRVQDFLAHSLVSYGQARNMPDQPGTSRFSPYLAHGELSPRQIWHSVEAFIQEHHKREDSAALHKAAPVFLREIVWREFAYHVLYHFPHTPSYPLKEKFEKMPWKTKADWLKSWQKGQTGYPLVDAGMRQLWHTGWMHNRVRMVVGSFLTKDLLIPWQEGAHWFWDTLVDADLANNSLNWQWVAGCGADAQPFFRIFNPVSQSEKFDPHGTYIRRWVPELSALDAKQIHAPWQVKPSQRLPSKLTLGKDYPAPIVDHTEARAKALQLYASLKASSD